MSKRRNWLADLTVRSKISIAVGVTVLSTLAVAGAGFTQTGNLNTAITTINERNVAGLSQITGIRQAFGEVVLYGMQSRVADEQSRPPLIAKLNTAIGNTDELFKTYAGREVEDAEWQGLVQNFDAFWTMFKEAAKTLESADPASVGYTSAAGDYTPSLARVDWATADLTEYENNAAGLMATAAQATVDRARWTIGTVLLVGMVLALVLTQAAARAIVRPLGEVQRVMEAVAGGDLTRRARVRSRDELGKMAAAVNRAADEMRSAMHTLADNAVTLSSSADELTRTSDQIAAVATSVSQRAQTVTSAAGQVSQNVQTVAAGATEMGSSIQEIARSTRDGSDVAEQAVTAAQTTNDIMSKLNTSSNEIGTIVKVISAIAEQTNLLALNATIEAARAGDAGRGFAVVAGEVKDLSQETARATEDITRQVETIQTDSRAALAAIATITEIIGRIDESQTTIAVALEEQTATTKEMSRSIEFASDGSGEIASSISAVADGAQQTMIGAEANQLAANDLARMSADLMQVVARFRLDDPDGADAAAR
ncbi:hypothetical protein Val02_21820 [Virgisporangium aliadipatigenens]|uniref:Methyl-accepting chemotaxis protein n=1 Tax=Virgisporangium aliadipatigenens TaxID=741659 RepID=A0A8J4DPU9_9ACTN|nr:methyl-accepting chemotaxis protein [Virgisporangium aliadipatigenens]GIJ45296.1 hypothetical protein Val02_21820 [Virgisporangium aliadipatigenens]